MVYTLMPRLLAMLALVIGERSPMLFEPSVSNITTLLLALLSLSRDTALASPMPIAVPSWMSPLAAMSVLTVCSMLSREVWSVVIGHCVNASPAKMVSPMLSFGLSAINSAATSLAASMRLGVRSSASIDVETSIASMMSIPSTCLLPHDVCVCGLAKMITASANVAHLSSTGRFISRIRQLLGA